jgi:hypothetical protein
MIDFRGYAYTRTLSAISGDLVTVYDPQVPQVWHVPLRDRADASLVVKAPRGGYVVPGPFATEIAPRLEAHGIALRPMQDRKDGITVEAFRANHVKFSAAPFEGRMRAAIEGAWREETLSVLPGALFIPVNQRLARLVVALFEPQAPDSFAAWGFFNACFEQKEQMEPYVAEQIAKEVLAKNPGLSTEFAHKLKHDAEFANNPSGRLEFFLRHHVSWDTRYNLYPVLRTEMSLV